MGLGLAVGRCPGLVDADGVGAAPVPGGRLGTVLAAAAVLEGDEGRRPGRSGDGVGIAASACWKPESIAGDVAIAGVSSRARVTAMTAIASLRGRSARTDGRDPVVCGDSLKVARAGVTAMPCARSPATGAQP